MTLKCRICGCSRFETIMDLGDMALTGRFPKPEQDVQKEPLKLLRCLGECGLVQLEKAPDLSELYGQTYGYRSGLNRSMVAHLHDLVQHLTNAIRLVPGDVVVDIGSNDGTTLGFYPKEVRRIGIDPSGYKFKEFYPEGAELIPTFFDSKYILEKTQGLRARIVTSIAMFYDLEDPLSFMRGVAEILDPDGVWLMEQSYLPAMLRANAFDTICHEHLEYYALKQIEWMAEKAGLVVIRALQTPTNGGSFVLWLKKKKEGYQSKRDTVDNLREWESQFLLNTFENFRAFALRSEAAASSLYDFLAGLKSQGKVVYGLGASTKGNVLLQFMQDTSVKGGPKLTELIGKIGDVNPDKFGCITPGTNIPIISEADALADCPDYFLVLPWHFRQNFLSNPKFKGRKLIFPLPQLEVVTVLP